MSRNLREAAQRLKDAAPEEIQLIAKHDWDMIRDVASGYLGTTSPADEQADAGRVAPADLESTLVDVCQLIDGWHTDVAWTEWDEEVRYRVHCVLAKLNGQEPLPRDKFRHA